MMQTLFVEKMRLMLEGAGGSIININTDTADSTVWDMDNARKIMPNKRNNAGIANLLKAVSKYC